MSRKVFSITELIPALAACAREAGAVIMQHYQSGHAVESKDDASPVTEADRAADRLIVAALKSLAPDIPIVSEEGDKPDVTGADRFWLVDPLDGTRSFIRGNGYFTVNIGLIEHAIPTFGIIYDPLNDVLYWGYKEIAFVEHRGKSATAIQTREKAKNNIAALISHSAINPKTEAYLVAQGVTERIPCPSSIKFCFLAEGKADIYPRFGTTMEWDVAAGHAILNAAGGKMTNLDGTPFLYGKPGFLNGSFLASGK